MEYFLSGECARLPVHSSQENNIKGIPECPLSIIEPTDVVAQSGSHQQRISLAVPL